MGPEGVVELLIQRGADVNAKNQSGVSPVETGGEERIRRHRARAEGAWRKIDAGWLAPGARRHVLKIVSGRSAPDADALDRRLVAHLRKRPLRGAAAAIARQRRCCPTAKSWARCWRSRRRRPRARARLDAFFPQVERSGRELARLRLTPEQATEALRRIRQAPGHRRWRIASSPRASSCSSRRFRPVSRRSTKRARAKCGGWNREARRTEEQERRRIGRELHDEAGQSLLLLRLQLEMLERSAPERVRAGLGEARETVERIVDGAAADRGGAESRRCWSGWGWRPRSGNWPRGSRRPARADVRLRIRGLRRRCPMESQEVIYRVAQESSAEHRQTCAARPQVNLSLESTDKSIRLRVADNGAGFAVEAASGRPMSFGLAGMRERAALLGGTLAVRSAPGKGAAVTLRLPVVRIRWRPMAKIRVLLTDDHTLFRQAIRTLLAAEPDMEVVGEAANAVRSGRAGAAAAAGRRADGYRDGRHEQLRGHPADPPRPSGDPRPLPLDVRRRRLSGRVRRDRRQRLRPEGQPGGAVAHRHPRSASRRQLPEPAAAHAPGGRFPHAGPRRSSGSPASAR